MKKLFTILTVFFVFLTQREKQIFISDQLISNFKETAVIVLFSLMGMLLFKLVDLLKMRGKLSSALILWLMLALTYGIAKLIPGIDFQANFYIGSMPLFFASFFCFVFSGILFDILQHKKLT